MKKIFEKNLKSLEKEVQLEIQGEKKEKDLPIKWVKLFDDLIYGNFKKEFFVENYNKLIALRKIMQENLK